VPCEREFLQAQLEPPLELGGRGNDEREFEMGAKRSTFSKLAGAAARNIVTTYSRRLVTPQGSVSNENTRPGCRACRLREHVDIVGSGIADAESAFGHVLLVDGATTTECRGSCTGADGKHFEGLVAEDPEVGPQRVASPIL